MNVDNDEQTQEKIKQNIGEHIKILNSSLSRNYAT